MEREAREMQANAEHTAHLAIWRSLAKVNREWGGGRGREKGEHPLELADLLALSWSPE